jgi:hypothetical protein
MAAVGGPVPAPPGVVTVESLAAEALLAAAEAAVVNKAGSRVAAGRGHRGGSEGLRGGPQGIQRASGRLRGEQLPTAVSRSAYWLRMGD